MSKMWNYYFMFFPNNHCTQNWDSKGKKTLDLINRNTDSTLPNAIHHILNNDTHTFHNLFFFFSEGIVHSNCHQQLSVSSEHWTLGIWIMLRVYDLLHDDPWCRQHYINGTFLVFVFQSMHRIYPLTHPERLQQYRANEQKCTL